MKWYKFILDLIYIYIFVLTQIEDLFDSTLLYLLKERFSVSVRNTFCTYLFNSFHLLIPFCRKEGDWDLEDLLTRNL